MTEAEAIDLRRLDPRRMTSGEVRDYFALCAKILEQLVEGHRPLVSALNAMLSTSPDFQEKENECHEQE